MSYGGYLKMAENNTSVAYKFDESSDCEGYNNVDIGDNESLVPDSDPDSLDIEVSWVGSSEVSSDHTYFGEEWDKPFTQDSGPSLPENIDVSVAKALDYFNLLFKTEVLSDIRYHTDKCTFFKKEEIQRNRNNPKHVDCVWQETIVKELKSLTWNEH